MRTDHPDPAERLVLDAEDRTFAALLAEHLAQPSDTNADAREQFWIRAVDRLGPLAACRLNAAIARHEALAARPRPTDRRS